MSIAPSNTEILHALGLGRRIVGVDKWSDYPPRVLRLPNVGSDLEVDVERVAALEPDLVVASLHVPGMEDNIPRLEQAGLKYLAIGGVGLDGVWEDLRVIGRFHRTIESGGGTDRTHPSAYGGGRRTLQPIGGPTTHSLGVVSPPGGGRSALVGHRDDAYGRW